MLKRKIIQKRVIALVLAMVLLVAIPLLTASAVSVDDDYDIYANEREPENPSKTCQPGQHTWGKPCYFYCNGAKTYCEKVNWICMNSCSATKDDITPHNPGLAIIFFEGSYYLVDNWCAGCNHFHP